jgi:lysophospholipase L1-like esterase
MRTRIIIVAAAAGAVAIALAVSGGAGSTSSATVTAPFRLVVLGDSTAQASECPGCTDYVHLFAKDIEKARGRRVLVDNRGAPRQGFLPMSQVSQALGNVYADDSLRHAIAGADIVVIGLGFNDTAWDRLDNPCEAAPEFPLVHWDQISDNCNQRVTREFKQALDVLLTQIDQLRAHKPTLVRVVTPYDAVIGDQTDPGWHTPEAARVARRGNSLMTRAQCEIAGFHSGICADVYHALNGPDGRDSAQEYLIDGTHLNQTGHRRVARLLAELGYAPLT